MVGKLGCSWCFEGFGTIMKKLNLNLGRDNVTIKKRDLLFVIVQGSS